MLVLCQTNCLLLQLILGLTLCELLLKSDFCSGYRRRDVDVHEEPIKVEAPPVTLEVVPALVRGLCANARGDGVEVRAKPARTGSRVRFDGEFRSLRACQKHSRDETLIELNPLFERPDRPSREICVPTPQPE